MILQKDVVCRRLNAAMMNKTRKFDRLRIHFVSQFPVNRSYQFLLPFSAGLTSFERVPSTCYHIYFADHVCIVVPHTAQNTHWHTYAFCNTIIWNFIQRIVKSSSLKWLTLEEKNIPFDDNLDVQNMYNVDFSLIHCILLVCWRLVSTGYSYGLFTWLRSHVNVIAAFCTLF